MGFNRVKQIPALKAGTFHSIADLSFFASFPK